ncbi:MAG TPA: Uma2 family endonuclease [Thermoanaerobaculia bacterium]|nr:Uma2 family endonuclease [Thermoanaerobaculia bacterium]
MQQSRRNYTLDDYFDVERHSTIKHEYLTGQIFAMAGASYRHNQIAANLLASVGARLRDTPCTVLGSDMRVLTASGLYTYPDVVIVCGAVELAQHPLDPGETLTNPTAIVEILSRSTGEYDLQEKYDHYRSIPSFRECLFVEQDIVGIERRWEEGGTWRSESQSEWKGVIRFHSVAIEVAISEIYERLLKPSA